MNRDEFLGPRVPPIEDEEGSEVTPVTPEGENTIWDYLWLSAAVFAGVLTLLLIVVGALRGWFG